MLYLQFTICQDEDAMNSRTAALLLAGICVVIATLLFTSRISASVRGILFAGSLLFLGLASGGFQKKVWTTMIASRPHNPGRKPV